MSFWRTGDLQRKKNPTQVHTGCFEESVSGSVFRVISSSELTCISFFFLVSRCCFFFWVDVSQELERARMNPTEDLDGQFIMPAHAKLLAQTTVRKTALG